MKKEGFLPCTLLCHHHHWVAWGLGHDRMERDNRKPIWPLGISFPEPWVRTREYFLELSLFALMSSFGFQAVLCLGWGIPQGENSKLTYLVILWILVFFLNLPATIYFLASSNSCSINLARFYNCIKQERQDGVYLLILPAWSWGPFLFAPGDQWLSIHQHTTSWLYQVWL